VKIIYLYAAKRYSKFCFI